MGRTEIFFSFALLAAAVAAVMEAVAWATHKHVMHGILWILHEDHHRPRRRGFQKNDLFAVFFAGLSILLFAWGRAGSSWASGAAGAGMALYGLGYFLFHDVMFHKRIPWLHLKAGTYYLKRIVRAHVDHHQSFGKGEARSFGFLYAPRRFDIRNSGAQSS
jgi:beta-carotene 3-hydroxylase